MTYATRDIDAKPAANRALEWISFLHGQTGELYYAADVCAGMRFFFLF